MNTERNVIVAGQHGRPVVLDAYYLANGQPKPIVLFAHGIKGFKDWGFWHLIAEQFAAAGFVFIKFNFSHNGTTPADPAHFGDLEAFGHNNYSKELADIGSVLDWLPSLPADESDLNRIHLIGHSRGGGIGIVKTSLEPRIRSLITWAAVDRLDYAWQNPQMVADWQDKGIYHIINGRTGQEMPVYYQFYEDFLAHQPTYDVEYALSKMSQPLLVIHGTEDEAVPERAAHYLQQQHASAQLHLIEGANHVFGGSHPYDQTILTPHAQELVDVSLTFLKNQDI